MFRWVALEGIGCRASLVAKPSGRLLFAVDGMGRRRDLVAIVDQERDGGLSLWRSRPGDRANELVSGDRVGFCRRHSCRPTKYLRLGAFERNVDLLAQLVGGLVVDVEDIFDPTLGCTLGVDPPAKRVVADLDSSGRDRGQHHASNMGFRVVGAWGRSGTVALCPGTDIVDHRRHALARS